MANNNNKKEKEKDLEFSFNEDVEEGEQQDHIEPVKFESESSSDGGSDDDGNHTAYPHSFSSQQWPQSYK